MYMKLVWEKVLHLILLTIFHFPPLFKSFCWFLFCFLIKICASLRISDLFNFDTCLPLAMIEKQGDNCTKAFLSCFLHPCLLLWSLKLPLKQLLVPISYVSNKSSFCIPTDAVLHIISHHLFRLAASCAFCLILQKTVSTFKFSWI